MQRSIDESRSGGAAAVGRKERGPRSGAQGGREGRQKDGDDDECGGSVCALDGCVPRPARALHPRTRRLLGSAGQRAVLEDSSLRPPLRLQFRPRQGTHPHPVVRGRQDQSRLQCPR